MRQTHIIYNVFFSTMKICILFDKQGLLVFTLACFQAWTSSFISLCLPANVPISLEQSSKAVDLIQLCVTTIFQWFDGIPIIEIYH